MRLRDVFGERYGEYYNLRNSASIDLEYTNECRNFKRDSVEDKNCTVLMGHPVLFGIIQIHRKKINMGEKRCTLLLMSVNSICSVQFSHISEVTS